MSGAKYMILVLCTGLSLLFGVTLLVFHGWNDRVEKDVEEAQKNLLNVQTELQRGELSRRALQNIVGDLSTVAGSKPEVRSIMTRYGMSLRKSDGGN